MKTTCCAEVVEIDPGSQLPPVRTLHTVRRSAGCLASVKATLAKHLRLFPSARTRCFCLAAFIPRHPTRCTSLGPVQSSCHLKGRCMDFYSNTEEGFKACQNVWWDHGVMRRMVVHSAVTRVLYFTPCALPPQNCKHDLAQARISGVTPDSISVLVSGSRCIRQCGMRLTGPRKDPPSSSAEVFSCRHKDGRHLIAGLGMQLSKNDA